MKSKITQDKSLTKHYRNSKIFSLLDIIVIALLLVTIVLCFIFTLPKSQGQRAVIYNKGEIIGIYSLSENKTITLLDGQLTCVIEDNSIYVKESDCKNQICVHTNKISKTGQRIVCSPNKITIVVEGDDGVLITGGAL